MADLAVFVEYAAIVNPAADGSAVAEETDPEIVDDLYQRIIRESKVSFNFSIMAAFYAYVLSAGLGLHWQDFRRQLQKQRFRWV